MTERKDLPPTNTPLILCVEDEAELLNDLEEELAEAGYRTISTLDGASALAALDEATPDLILCDISMPGLTGYDVLRAVRGGRPELADTPFVFLTALADRGEIVEGKKAGADDYLVKPIDFDLMLATIEARLREVERIRANRAQKGAEGLHSAFVQAFDLLGFGTVLIGERCEVIFANRAARHIAEQKDGIRIDRRIQAEDGLDDRKVREMLGDLQKAADTAPSTASLSLPRPSGKHDYLLVASKVASAQGLPVTALFIIDPDQPLDIPHAILADLFKLTPTETEVALALAKGMRTSEIAAELAIAQTTVSFHLKNLFEKTGTNRQADLIALILSCPISTGRAELLL